MAVAQTEQWWGTGRRKTSVARVRLRRGSGRIHVNGRDADEYFVTERARGKIRGPLRTAQATNKYDVLAQVHGGGLDGQADALLLGIARALEEADPELHQILKDAGFLTRDAREKERKKYGRRGARAGFQFSKR